MPDGEMSKISEEKVPIGWRAISLGSVSDVRVSGVDKLARESEEPVRLCNYIDVYKNDYITGDLLFMHASATKPEIERFSLRIGDVVITKDSETPDDIGISAVVDYAAPDLVCGYHLALLRPKAGEVDSTFLAKQLKHHRLARYFGQRANGLTRYGLPNAVITNAPVWLPELPEQRTIGAILRSVDEAIAKTETVIAKLKQVRAGLLHDLLTRGLDENGELRNPVAHPEQFQDSPLGRIPREWQVGPFREFGTSDRPYLKTGPFGSSLKQEHWVPEGVPVVTIGSLGEGEFILSEILHVSMETARLLAAYSLLPGDIVFSRVADVGRSVVVTEAERGWIMSSNMMWISVDRRRADPEYVQLNISANAMVRRQIEGLVNSAGREVANAAVMNSLRLPWAPPTEQRHIVLVLGAIDANLRGEQITLKKLYQLKSGVMNDLLTGRVRVPENVMDGRAHS